MGGVSLLTLAALLSLLLAPLPVFGADCTVATAGTPTDGNGIPQCPCGFAYYATCAFLQPGCVTCPAEFASDGCYANASSDYTDATTNVRCQCSTDPSGTCCQTDGTFSSASTVCRTSSDCALAAYCSGNATDCPAATPAPPDTICIGSTGPCQGDAFCDGTSLVCPSSAAPFLSSDTVCANSTGPCQLNATCTGSSAACPTQAYAAPGSVCDPAASGECEADAVCDGASAACPARALLDVGTTCYNASGACETNATCDGVSSLCPAPSFVARGTVCDPAPSTGCFGNGVCAGNSATCGAQPRKASGADCGANPLCLTAYSNNTCNSIGFCNTGQCSSCANGLQGGDCSCCSIPPTGGGPYRCTAGVWNTTIRVNSPSVHIYPNSLVFMTSNLSTSSLIFEGTNSTILLSGCANLTQILILLSAEEIQLIESFPTGITQMLIQHVNDNWDCSTLTDTRISISSPPYDGCKRVTVKTSSNFEDGLIVTFATDNSNCEDPGANNRKWIIVGTVVAVVILFALITAIVIFTVNEKARRCIHLYPKSKAPEGADSVL